MDALLLSLNNKYLYISIELKNILNVQVDILEYT